jgi:hypothetical protein
MTRTQQRLRPHSFGEPRPEAQSKQDGGLPSRLPECSTLCDLLGADAGPFARASERWRL